MRLAALGKRWEGGERVPVKKIEETTKARITLAACLRIDGVKPYDMTDSIYPRNPDLAPAQRASDRTRRFDATKKLLDRHRDRIELEKRRLAALPQSERNATRDALSTQIHSLP